MSAPAEVQVYEDTRLLGTSRSDRIMVSAGRHELDIVNEALDYRSDAIGHGFAGTSLAVRLEWPKDRWRSTRSRGPTSGSTASSIGETPIGNVSVPIGPHEIVFRHPELGEQVVRATVTVARPHASAST